MATLYVEIPHNFKEVEQYIIQDKEEILKEMLTADKCYFYDTCSIRKHAHMKNPQCLCDYVHRSNGVVILTRCIIMELASLSGILNDEYIKFLKYLWTEGVNVLVLYEEDIYDLMSLCFSSNAKINDCLSWAVKVVKRPTSTIYTTLQEDKILFKHIVNGNITEGDLFARFFRSVRNNKESDDNLGEELIAICIHLLSNIPDRQAYKFIVFTEDKGAIGLVNKISKNVYEHTKRNTLSALTTARLTQILYEEKIIDKRSQVEELLSLGMTNGIIKVIGSEKYDLDIKEKTMTYSQLAEKIMSPNEIHINF